MPHSTTLPAPLALPSGGGLLTLIEMAVSFLRRDRLTAEERALVERVRTISEKYGAYLLEAEDREALEARVDAVIEDPQFHKDFLSALAPLNPAVVSGLAQSHQDKDIRDSGIAQALGPAALPALRRLDSCMAELRRCVGTLFKGATPAMELPALHISAAEPLAFLSNPEVPVPLARALLSTLRTNALVLAVGAAQFNESLIERWLGLALAEMLAEESRGTLALLAAATGTEVPASLLPPDERLDLQALQQSTESVQKAYARFNAAAERSGEPVFPSES